MKNIEIQDLIFKLNNYIDAYNQGYSMISDEEYDRLYFKLKDIEESTGIIYPNSPTQIIRYEVQSELQKVTHNHPMLSLEKCHTEQEVESFIKNHEWIAMLKMDGLTCSLLYQNGQLVRAETRGNGTIGEDITHNAKVVYNIPQTIPFKEELVVDGEIICDDITFNAFFAEDYANSRNFAAGSIRLLNPEECKKRHLKFIAWDCIKGLENCVLLSQKLKKLQIFGFDNVPFVSSLDMNHGDVHEVIDDMRTLAIETWHFPIDGIVWKWDDCRAGKALGRTEHHFKNGLAFKFLNDSVETELLDIVYEAGRTGKLTPVAIYKPVELNGSTCNKASLHNLTIMKQTLGECPYVGQTINVIKANDIIPQIKEADTTYYEKETYLHAPEVCPICGEKTQTISENDSAVLYCSNENCPARIINQFEHFCGKSGLDVKGLSKQTLDKLLDWGWINNYVDLWYLGKMYRDEWIHKPGFGVASVDKILAAIESSRKVDFDKFIAALGIPLIGSRASKDLANHFKTWDAFIEAVEEDYKFYDLPNFGIEMHKALKYFDYSEAKELATTVLNIQSIKTESVNNKLEGKIFVITGKLTLGSRDKAKQMVEAAGGKVSGSVSAKTSYLVNNDISSTTSKNTTAKKFGIPIITEEEFLALLEE